MPTTVQYVLDAYKIYYAKESISILGGNVNLPNSGGGSKTTQNTSITISDLSADTTYHFVVATNHLEVESAAPEVTADSSYIAELAIGDWHGCVRLNTGRIKCWGYNKEGQLGVDDTTDKHTATDLSGNFRAKQLAAGGNHSCAINLNDKLYCWGYNDVGQLGLSQYDAIIKAPKATKAGFDVSVVGAGKFSTCVVAGGNYCWGLQKSGGLGNAPTDGERTYSTEKIKNITPDVKQFALGQSSGCATDASADLWCWGSNVEGQVGDGTNENQLSPVHPKLQGSSKATMLDGGYWHYCVVDKATKIQCWGWNKHGQLGINNNHDKNSPQYVLASNSTTDHLSGVSKVVAGQRHSCAIIGKGSVRCWGSSEHGRIGDATADRLVADTDMKTINNAIDIAAGARHTCVLLNDKTSVQCWGRNAEGELGNNTIINSPTPVEVVGIKDTYQ